LVHKTGIEVDNNKAETILEARPSSNKKELQSLLGKINFLKHFIMNLVGKMKPFMALLKLKHANQFLWGKEQEAFDQIKSRMSRPLILIPPRSDTPVKLYISTANESIGSLLVQDDQ
jgi:hypothetical protein